MQTGKPGKAPTKGAKQILVENEATISFYRNMGLAAVGLHALIVLLIGESFAWFMNFIIISLQVGSYQLMKYVSRPRYTDSNQLIDPGIDLNMEGGMGEHIKDIVILSSVTHVAAAISNYFWFLLLLLPLRAFYLLWINILGPWFFQAPPDEDDDEKKRKKLDKKMKRVHFNSSQKK
ncbi:transmembrane protein 208 [Amyelois transitella]|uniref:transmembrane protein 208 n=1 Tax=Amyelois transitella TaxID=680683 RepID=UPI00067AD0EB|nr:transmembrane protein 208 [Amyelois transitella]